MPTALKIILAIGIIIIAIPLLYAGLFFVIVFYHEIKPPERIQLFWAEHEGLTIEMVKLLKIRLGDSDVQYILFLNDQPAWSNNRVLDKKIKNVANWPRPVLREDLQKIIAMRYVLPDSIESWKGSDIWIDPAQFSREDFERLCDFIETRYQDDPHNAFEGQKSGDMTFYFRWIIYADATQFSERVYTAPRPDNRKEFVVLRLNGHVVHYLENEDGYEKIIYSGDLDTNTYHISLVEGYFGEYLKVGERTPYQYFVDKNGNRLTDYFSISIDSSR